MNVKVQSKNLEPRLSSLETSVETLTLDMREIIRSIDSLRSLVADHQRPQWGNMISAIGVSVVIIGAIGSSFIAPLTITSAMHDKVLEQRGASIENIKDRLRELESLVSSNAAVSTSELDHLNHTIEDVRLNGSGITRERLAVIENRLQDLAGQRLQARKPMKQE